MSKKTFTLIIIIILIILGAGFYWFFIHVPATSINTSSGNNTSGNGIFTSSGTIGGHTNKTISSSSVQTNANSPTAIAVPTLREISATPVGGMISSTTASNTVLRWVDRGTGHIYQAYGDNTSISEISDITVPMIYQSYWNTGANAFIFQSLTENSDTVTSFYASLKATATSTSSTTTTTPYSLSGSPLPTGTLAIAVSPSIGKTGNEVFTLVTDGNGGAAGFTFNFDGSRKTQIFDTPLTELNVQWPSLNTLAITTKGTAAETGFLYFVNPKVGLFNKVIGGMRGLSTLVNASSTEVLYSRTNNAGTGITTAVYNIATGQVQALPFSTLAEKCVWSKIQTSDLYCAIPFNIPANSYPDAWYQGTVSFSDSIWEIDTITGDIHELVDLTKMSGQQIDAENLQLNPNENFLYFMNKDDLSLWSFDLNAI